MLSPQDFRAACSRFATGITVVTVADAAGNPHGLTVNSFTSVSLTPTLVLVCLDLRTNALPHFQSASSFAIHVLSEAQQDLSVRFAQWPEGRFQGIEWRFGDSGAPLLGGCLAEFECKMSRVIEAGDHLILLGEVLRAEAREGEPLIYFGSRYRTLSPL